MVLELMLPEEGGKGSRFANILQNEERMSAIFEAFVRNFYKQEARDFSQSPQREVIAWDTDSDLVSHMNYLAVYADRRHTAVSYPHNCHRREILRRNAGVSHLGGQNKVRSAHLYQLLSVLYLTNWQMGRGQTSKWKACSCIHAPTQYDSVLSFSK